MWCHGPLDGPLLTYDDMFKGFCVCVVFVVTVCCCLFSSDAEAVACGASSFRYTIHICSRRLLVEQFFLRHTANGYLRLSPSARLPCLLLLCVVCMFVVCVVFACVVFVFVVAGNRPVP